MAGEIVNVMIERGDMAPSQVEMACEALVILNTKVGEEMAIFLLTSMIHGGELKNVDTFVDRVEDVCNAFNSLDNTIKDYSKSPKIDTFSGKAN
jgi:hypothetical protein